MCSYALCCLLQIEVKLKKRDGLRWTALERDPTASKIMQFVPEGRSQWELQNGTCCWGLCHSGYQVTIHLPYNGHIYN